MNIPDNIKKSRGLRKSPTQISRGTSVIGEMAQRACNPMGVLCKSLSTALLQASRPRARRLGRRCHCDKHMLPQPVTIPSPCCDRRPLHPADSRGWAKMASRL